MPAWLEVAVIMLVSAAMFIFVGWGVIAIFSSIVNEYNNRKGD